MIEEKLLKNENNLYEKRLIIFFWTFAFGIWGVL